MNWKNLKNIFSNTIESKWGKDTIFRFFSTHKDLFQDFLVSADWNIEKLSKKYFLRNPYRTLHLKLIKSTCRLPRRGQCSSPAEFFLFFFRGREKNESPPPSSSFLSLSLFFGWPFLYFYHSYRFPSFYLKLRSARGQRLGRDRCWRHIHWRKNVSFLYINREGKKEMGSIFIVW